MKTDTKFKTTGPELLPRREGNKSRQTYSLFLFFLHRRLGVFTSIRNNTTKSFVLSVFIMRLYPVQGTVLDLDSGGTGWPDSIGKGSGNQ
jgi:hypothetical protein